ncbi:MAG: sodium:proton antiporter [Bifidobacterium sp.]|nr:sodium:proton antiporter [Bifidobacterium sp.]
MPVFTLILCIIAAVVLSSFLSRFIPKVSTPLVQIALGLVCSQLPFFPETELDPELFMVLFIAPLLYLEAHNIDKNQLLKSLKLSLSLAVGLAIATMVAVGFTVHAVWPMIPLAAALALGAALGPTDAVAVSSLSNEAALTQRQVGVLKGESLFNDASGIVGFQFAIAAALTGQFEVGDAVVEFLVSFFGGALLGVAMGMAINWVFERIRAMGWETTTTRVLMELFLPFMLYLTAEVCHVSGILCVVAAGLMIRFDRSGVGPNVARTNIVASSVWHVFEFSLNGAVFFLLGMILPDAMAASWESAKISNVTLVEIILVVSLVVVGMRFAWCAAMLRLTHDETTHKRRPMRKERWRYAAVMTFGGPKGTITLSLMFTIPYLLNDGEWFPMRDELIFTAGGVIIVTLLLANFLLPMLAPNRDKDGGKELTEATIELLRRTVEELAERVEDTNRRAVMTVIDSYTKRITRLKLRIGAIDPAGFVDLQVAALDWEKEYIKRRLSEAKIAQKIQATSEGELEIEACERMLDQIMTTLRHTQTDRDHAMWRLRGRLRSIQRRTRLLASRVSNLIRRSTPMLSEDEIYAHMRALQLDGIDHVIDRLYEEMGRDEYNTEYCSALLLDYRLAESALRSRPTMSSTTELVSQIDEVKRDSYAIELRIIQDMFEEDEITRDQGRQLRKNVYVMSVDADSSI